MKQTLADAAYEQLLYKIYSLELKGGDRVIEQQLIDILGIGRTPVRQAIQHLTNDGLLDAKPGTFAIVHTFTEKECCDFGIVRLIIDTIASPLVILNGSNRDFQDLMEIAIACEKASERNDILERIRLDFAFHNAFVALSDNHELTKIQEQLTKRGRLMQLQIYNQQGVSFCDLSGHLDIIHALTNHDMAACTQAIKTHLEHSYGPAFNKTPEWKTLASVLNQISPFSSEHNMIA